MNIQPFSIFLSASVPDPERNEKFRRMPNAQRNIEEAVISLCRCIFQNKGRVIFGSHPSISPLIAMVATEFTTVVSPKDAPILIFQSRLFDRFTKPESVQHFHLLNTVRLELTPIKGNEVWDQKIKDKPQCPLSLGLMRDRMMEQNPDAMISIGGMDGVIDEYHKFRSHPLTQHKPVYLIPFTGGATAVLCQEPMQHQQDIVVHAQPLTSSSKVNPRSLDLYPYPTIMQQIIRSILSKKNH